MAAPEGEVVIDPTVHAATVEDTWLEDATNHGDRDRLLVGKSAGNPKKRTLIKFDLTGIPAGVELSDAKMRLQYYGRGGNLNATWVDRPVAAHKILVDWNELEATTTRRVIDVAAQNVNAIDVLWNASYGQSGSDYSAIAEDTQFITPDYPRWVSWDIKALTQQWVDVPATNYGVMLLATNEDVDGFDLRFRSSDYTADEQFRPKLEIRWTLATRTTYFLKDHLGTTRAAITDAGDVVGYDDYDPWGLILANRNMTSQPDLPFKYTGKEWDDDNGLDWYYFGMRYYDPQIARWLSIDPLAGSHSDYTPYHYTFNNPLRYIDLVGADTTNATVLLLWAATKQAIKSGASASRAAGIATTGVVVGVASAIVLGTPGEAGEKPIGNKGEDVDGDGLDDSKDLVHDKKKNEGDQFVVRLQAQGDGLENSQVITRTRPVTAIEAVAALEALKVGLTKRQLKERNVAFLKAEKKIIDISKAGGTGPAKFSFTNPGTKGSKARVDLEILRGNVNIVK